MGSSHFGIVLTARGQEQEPRSVTTATDAGTRNAAIATEDACMVNRVAIAVAPTERCACLAMGDDPILGIVRLAITRDKSP